VAWDRDLHDTANRDRSYNHQTDNTPATSATNQSQFFIPENILPPELRIIGAVHKLHPSTREQLLSIALFLERQQELKNTVSRKKLSYEQQQIVNRAKNSASDLLDVIKEINKQDNNPAT
ncbi:MAG: hypothetical protein WBM44_27125, partial [Waterburya sp.]